MKLGTGLSDITVRAGSGALVTARFANGTAAIIHNPAVGKARQTRVSLRDRFLSFTKTLRANPGSLRPAIVTRD